MIDPLNEQVVSLSDAAKLLPGRRQSKRPHISCIYRWTVNGCSGVVLESIQVGGTRCTSHEALARFMSRLTAAVDKPSAERPLNRAKSVASALRSLERNGV